MAIKLDADKVRRIRELQALRREDLAARSGVSLSTIAQVEQDKRPVHIGTVGKLARALKVAPEHLYPGEAAVGAEAS